MPAHGRGELVRGELQTQRQQQQHDAHRRRSIEEGPGGAQRDRPAFRHQQAREQEQRRRGQADAQRDRPGGSEQDQQEAELDEEGRVALHGPALTSSSDCTLRTPVEVPITISVSPASST